MSKVRHGGRTVAGWAQMLRVTPETVEEALRGGNLMFVKTTLLRQLQGNMLREDKLKRALDYFVTQGNLIDSPEFMGIHLYVSRSTNYAYVSEGNHTIAIHDKLGYTWIPVHVRLIDDTKPGEGMFDEYLREQWAAGKLRLPHAPAEPIDRLDVDQFRATPELMRENYGLEVLDLENPRVKFKRPVVHVDVVQPVVGSVQLLCAHCMQPARGLCAVCQTEAYCSEQHADARWLLHSCAVIGMMEAVPSALFSSAPQLAEQFAPAGAGVLNQHFRFFVTRDLDQELIQSLKDSWPVLTHGLLSWSYFEREVRPMIAKYAPDNFYFFGISQRTGMKQAQHTWRIAACAIVFVSQSEAAAAPSGLLSLLAARTFNEPLKSGTGKLSLGPLLNFLMLDQLAVAGIKHVYLEAANTRVIDQLYRGRPEITALWLAVQPAATRSAFAQEFAEQYPEFKAKYKPRMKKEKLYELLLEHMNEHTAASHYVRSESLIAFYERLGYEANDALCAPEPREFPAPPGSPSQLDPSLMDEPAGDPATFVDWRTLFPQLTDQPRQRFQRAELGPHGLPMRWCGLSPSMLVARGLESARRAANALQTVPMPERLDALAWKKRIVAK